MRALPKVIHVCRSNFLSIFCSNPFFFFQLRCKHQKNSTHTTCDMIGPPDPVSNLRPIKFVARENETDLEKQLRLKREELQTWNHEFWTKHNTDFFKLKEEFTTRELKKKQNNEQTVNADEMSVFYKKFLDENWKRHLHYNISWYRKNVSVTFLDFKVKFRRFLRYLGV